MTHWLITYAAVLVTFLVIDALWITFVARKLYDLEAGDVLREKPKFSAGILFYLLYAAGITAFAVLPLTMHFDGIHATVRIYSEVAAWGAALGVFAYSTFALTNQAIIRDWKYKLVFIDLLWGALITAGAALVGFAVFRALA